MPFFFIPLIVLGLIILFFELLPLSKYLKEILFSSLLENSNSIFLISEIVKVDGAPVITFIAFFPVFLSILNYRLQL